MKANLGLLTWKNLLADPFFQDLPYKVETTRNGSILMSPASNWHGSAQSQMVVNLEKGRKNGEIITECSILTSEGVKVADVAWASNEFMDAHGYKTPYLLAPEICIEIVSPGNSQEEIDRKIELYLAKGALEVWIVNEDASIQFYDKTGERPKSALVKTVKLKKRK